ncbi:MAG: tRNA pseudouridine(38-40) synthase TruA [Sulfuricurvum sp.]|nr:tRNA pseudouridine(38-40) synthase TruA [Sulfuricurvum sp.]
MNRVKITLSYNGAAYLGFQSQTTTPNTVVGRLSRAFESVGITSAAIGSGRTDRGVHATHQVIHLDLPHFWNDLKRLREMLNLQLPPSIRIGRIETVADDFHARYSASKRNYRYIIKEGESNPFEDDFVTFIPTINPDAILNAIGAFEGEHNFEFFKKTGSDVTHYVRTIYRAYGYRHRGYLILCFEANGFLRSQIRLMVGFLLRISSEKATKEQLIEQLNCVKRHSTDIAPHNGLYLTHIKY